MVSHVKPASQSLHNYGQYQRGLMLLIFIVSGIYWAIARYVDTPVFDEFQYGPFIMAVKAEIWLMPIFFASGVHLIGQVVNGDPRLQPWVTPSIRAISALVVSLDMLLFAYGGLYAPNYDLYFAYTGAVGWVTTWFFWMGANDLRRALTVNRNEK